MVQCDRFVQAIKPDTVVVDEEKKEVKMIDIAIPGGCRVKDKEQEKTEKRTDRRRDYKVVEHGKGYSNTCCDWSTRLHISLL